MRIYSRIFLTFITQVKSNMGQRSSSTNSNHEGIPEDRQEYIRHVRRRRSNDESACRFDYNGVLYSLQKQPLVVHENHAYLILKNKPSNGQETQWKLRCRTCNSNGRISAICDAITTNDTDIYYSNVRNFKYCVPSAPHDSSQCVADEVKIINEKGKFKCLKNPFFCLNV